MEEMREIVDLATVNLAINALGVALCAGGLLVGVLASALRRSAGWGPLVRGAFVALLGPLLIGLWRLHLWLTRYDPRTGYYGLDKVWVLVVSAVAFILIGVLYGYLAGRVWARTSAAPEEAASGTGKNGP